MPPMNATSYPKAASTHVTSNKINGERASRDGRTHEVFKLGLDISALRPRQRFVARVLLQRMNGIVLPKPPALKS
jgi:hypothetical protein